MIQVEAVKNRSQQLSTLFQKLQLSLLQKGKQSSFPEFFLNFFQKRYGDAPAFDWTYSVYENIKLYKSNEAMSLFHQILTGEVSSPSSHLKLILLP